MVSPNPEDLENCPLCWGDGFVDLPDGSERTCLNCLGVGSVPPRNGRSETPS